MTKQLKCNIGCGTEVKEGNSKVTWVNMDMHEENWERTIKERNWEQKGIPQGTEFVKHKLPGKMPLKNDTFDYIYVSHLLEDFNNEEFFNIMADIHRITKKSGLVEIRVPLRGYNGALANPHHQKLFQKNSFDWFAKDMGNINDYENDGNLFDTLVWSKVITRQSWLSHMVGEIYKKVFVKRILTARKSIKNRKGLEYAVYDILNIIPPYYDKEIRVLFKK